MELFPQSLARFYQRLTALCVRQKILAAAFFVIMVTTVVGYWHYNATPDMTALLNQSLSSDEITQISCELDTRQIPYQVTGDRVLVPSTRRIEVLGVLGYARHLPHDTNRAFDEIVKSIGLFDPPSVTDAKFLEAKQQTLQMIISQFPGVNSSVVVIDPSSMRNLAGPDVPPTATVFMSTDGDVRGTNKPLAESAADMVCGAVGGLVRSRVKVVINGINYPLANAAAEEGVGSDYVIDCYRQYEALYHDKIVNHLGFIHGLMVAVTVKLDLSTVEKRDHKVDPANGYNAQPSTDTQNTPTGNPTTAKTEYANDHMTEDVQMRQGPGDAQVIGAAVRVPRSYLIAAYRNENDGKNPDQAALKTFTESELDAIRADVKNCTGLTSDDAITVGTYSDQTPVPAAATATQAAVNPPSNILSAHLNQIGLGVLAIIAVVMVGSMVRKGTPAPAVAKLETEDKNEPEQAVPFAFLQNADSANLLAFLQEEHPQTIALVMAHLPWQKSSEILVGLPNAKQVEVVKRIAGIEQTNPAVIQEIERGLRHRLGNIASPAIAPTSDPDFAFEDLLLVSDQRIQAALNEVGHEDVCLALKTAGAALQQKLLANMADDAAQRIADDLQHVGPVRVRDVEAAQQKIIAAVCRWEDPSERRMVA